MNKYIFLILFFCLSVLVVNGQGQGTGNGNGTGNGSQNETPNPTDKRLKQNKTPSSSSLSIISKPRAVHTDIAKSKNIEGTVQLKVTFKKDGTIGKIKIIKGLPDGLTEQAVEAAKKIRFNPAIKKGKPVTVTKIVEYTFTIY